MNSVTRRTICQKTFSNERRALVRRHAFRERIGEIPLDEQGFAREVRRMVFGHALIERNDQVHVRRPFTREFQPAFGRQQAEVGDAGPQLRDGECMNPCGRIGARAEDFEAVARQLAQERFCNDAAC